MDPACCNMVMPNITIPPHRDVRALMSQCQGVVADEEIPPHGDVTPTRRDMSSNTMICSRPMGVCAF